jgi:hypothetical protein
VQGSQHRLQTLVLESERGFQCVLGFAALRFSRSTIGVIFVGELCQRGVGEVTLVFQIATGDELPLWVPGQPTLTIPEEFRHLILANPVMLLVIQDGDQHIQMAQQVAQAQSAGQGDGVVLAVAPFGRTLVQGMRFPGDVIAQGLKQTSQHGFAPGTGQDGEAGLQGEWRGSQRWSFHATAAERRPEDLGDGYAEEGGDHIRAVVDIRLQQKGAANGGVSRLGQLQRIDVQQQGGRTARGTGFWVEDMGLAEAQVEGLHLCRMFVQKVAKVGGGCVCRGDG